MWILFFSNLFYRSSNIPFWITHVRWSMIPQICVEILLNIFNLGDIIAWIIERIHIKDWNAIILNLSHSICNTYCQISRTFLDPKDVYRRISMTKIYYLLESL